MDIITHFLYYTIILINNQELFAGEDLSVHTRNGRGAASQNVGATFKDVSDSDTAKDLSGKVESCLNYGAVLGDRNVGGISGAMAMENDLDPEDDWQVNGDSSINVATELRAVLLSLQYRRSFVYWLSHCLDFHS